ncbi:hypothetical protein UFOVP1229_104 [uncultured Caudovirales phage]|uniref:Uncharacterized protein n=1 Tax=uncultured Caudovirales phage TaxID=2100421 RepID=A0A6J5RBH4_9CAUD|nr:hypothetical protein UFOVP1229_104 [uncultured Caudovirales phage]
MASPIRLMPVLLNRRDRIAFCHESLISPDVVTVRVPASNCGRIFAEIDTEDANAFRNRSFPVPDAEVPIPKCVHVSAPLVHFAKTVFAAFVAVLLAMIAPLFLYGSYGMFPSMV